MSRRERDPARPAPPDGLVIVDKPAGWTSHDVVSRMRRLAGTRRVGHAGTLDPMATGVLVVGLERATRLLGHLSLTRKGYDASIRLGQATVTDDAEGEVVAAAPAGHLDEAAIRAATEPFTGEIMQVPSSVSAIKVNGVRSYARVRSGDEVKLAPRPVTVFTFDVHGIRRSHDVVDVDVSVACSSGTYIRALARDLGEALGVGGHLIALRRTVVGPYSLADAHPLDQLVTAVDEGEPLPILPIAQAAAAAFPRYEASADQVKVIAHGGFLPSAGHGPGPIAVFGPDGTFLALVEEHGPRAKPIAVFV